MLSELKDFFSEFELEEEEMQALIESKTAADYLEEEEDNASRQQT